MATILPIAERELRVAVRSGKAHAFRRNIAGLALLLFFGLFWVSGSQQSSGPEIFGIFSILTFAYCVGAGIILAADSIASEQREGTLGLLFLTPLEPRDVIVGWIVSTGLKAFYGLLAAFPALGLCMILGGISYGDFARTCLALISTLVLSLSISLLASCWGAKRDTALRWAIIILFALTVALPLACAGLRRMPWPTPFGNGWVPILELFSPWTTLLFSKAAWFRNAMHFWCSLLIINGMSIVALGLASLILGRLWRTRLKPSGREAIQRDPTTKIFDVSNPIYPLISRKPLNSPNLLLSCLAMALVATWAGHSWLPELLGGIFSSFKGMMLAWGAVGLLLHLFLAFQLASLSARPLAEGRKSGAFELLLVSPMRVRTILRGHGKAAGRQVAGTALAVLFIHALILWASVVSAGLEEALPGGAIAVFKSLFAMLDTDPETASGYLFQSALIFGTGLLACGEWLTLASVGAWIGMRSKRPAYAAWIALGLVILPAAPIYSVLFLLPSWLGPQLLAFCFCACMGSVALYWTVLLLWSMRNLGFRFRAAAADRFLRSDESPWKSSLRITLRAGTAVAAIVLAIALIYLEEDWRGKRAWTVTARQLTANHETLGVRSIIPPSVPDAENFAMTPVFSGLFPGKDFNSGSEPKLSDDQQRMIARLASISLPRRAIYPRHWFDGSETNSQLWLASSASGGILTTATATGATANGSALAEFDGYEPIFSALRAAAHRPHSRFPVPYEEGFFMDAPFFTILPHVGVVRNLAQLLGLKSLIELSESKTGDAFEDIVLQLRLAASLQHEPGLYKQLRRQDILTDALHSLWIGLADHQWSNSQLAAFGKLFSRIDVLADYHFAWRTEMILQNNLWDHLVELLEKGTRLPGDSGPRTREQRWFFEMARKLYPTGWAYAHKAALVDWHRDYVGPIVDAPRRRVFPLKIRDAGRALKFDQVPLDPLFKIFMAPKLMQGLADGTDSFAQLQVVLDQAMIACALERYRLEKGDLPERLEALEPDYIARLPHDIMSGSAFHYSRLSTNDFVLYSAGANGIDDGGKAGTADDWIWRYPVGISMILK